MQHFTGINLLDHVLHELTSSFLNETHYLNCPCSIIKALFPMFYYYTSTLTGQKERDIHTDYSPPNTITLQRLEQVTAVTS
jgi:hypothetical protein